MNYRTIINNPEYRKVVSFEHTDIKNFLRNEIPQNHGWIKIAGIYQLLGMLVLILGVFKAFMSFYAHRETIYFIYLGIGVLFSFTILVVLHELVHALAYLFVGIRKLSFGMKLSKFIFYVQADGEVLNYKQFRIVALAPAVVVTVISLGSMVAFYNQPLFYAFLPILGLHSLFCGGDFGLLCFFQKHSDREIITFDLKDEGKTYFYEKIKPMDIDSAGSV